MSPARHQALSSATFPSHLWGMSYRQRAVLAGAVSRSVRWHAGRLRYQPVRHGHRRAAHRLRRRLRGRARVGRVPAHRTRERPARRLDHPDRGPRRRRAGRARRVPEPALAAHGGRGGVAVRHRQQRRGLADPADDCRVARAKRGTSPPRGGSPQRRHRDAVARRHRARLQAQRAASPAHVRGCHRPQHHERHPACTRRKRRAVAQFDAPEHACVRDRPARDRRDGGPRSSRWRGRLGEKKRAADLPRRRGRGDFRGGLVHGHRAGARGAAAVALPRHARRAHGPLQPHLSRRAHAGDAGARDLLGEARTSLRRSRRLQEGQRHRRPRSGGRAAARRGTPALQAA